MTLLGTTLAGPAHADAHAPPPGLEEWCASSQLNLALCVLGAAVVVPVVVLEEAGQAFEAACQADGGEYREDVGTAYAGQYGCTTWPG